MTLKNVALLALVGTILMTALLVWNFVFNFLNLLRGLVPAVTLAARKLAQFEGGKRVPATMSAIADAVCLRLQPENKKPSEESLPSCH